MKFRYKKLGARFVRPIIPVEILFEKQAVRYEVLVDSGADCTLLPSEIGELLGIDVESGRKDRIGGITGGGMPFFIHQVLLRVGGWTFEVPVGFMPGMPDFEYGVVGQGGFFDLFEVTFNRRKAEIALKPYRLPA